MPLFVKTFKLFVKTEMKKQKTEMKMQSDLHHEYAVESPTQNLTSNRKQTIPNLISIWLCCVYFYLAFSAPFSHFVVMYFAPRLPFKTPEGVRSPPNSLVPFGWVPQRILQNYIIYSFIHNTFHSSHGIHTQAARTGSLLLGGPAPDSPGGGGAAKEAHWH